CKPPDVVDRIFGPNAVNRHPLCRGWQTSWVVPVEVLRENERPGRTATQAHEQFKGVDALNRLTSFPGPAEIDYEAAGGLEDAPELVRKGKEPVFVTLLALVPI